MKKFILFLSFGLFLSACTDENKPNIDDETPIVKENLLKNWAGNNSVGNGSEPTEFGWVSSNNNAVWGPANSSIVGSTRYMDVSVNSNPQHLHQDSIYIGRILMYRWDGTYWGSVLSKSVYLKANTNYTFEWKYEWWSNGVLPTYNLAISKNNDGSEAIANKDFHANSTKNLLIDGEFKFKSNSEGEYYLVFTQSGESSANGTLIGMADLKLLED